MKLYVFFPDIDPSLVRLHRSGARQPVADSVASLANLPECKNETQKRQAIRGSPCRGAETGPQIPRSG
jgi:hypothetical protein